MDILYCTYYDLTAPSAGLNRIYKLRNSLLPYQINLIVVGSGLDDRSDSLWRITSLNNFRVILFNKKKFKSLGFSNFGRDLKSASYFYKNFLSELIKQLNICGIIIYAPFYSIVKTLIKIADKKLFIIADCGEYYNLSIKYILNGINIQQFLFKNFLIQKLSGLIVPSPMWYKKAREISKDRVFIPGIINKNNFYRKDISKTKSKANIVFIGSLSKRELPEIIFKALSICLDKKMSLNFNLIGNQNNREGKYWLKKLKKHKNLSANTSILGFLSEKEKNYYLMNADLFIMLRPNNNETKHLFPSRVPELLSSSNPIILTKTASLDFFFKENQGVKFISDKNNPKELAYKIMELISDPIKRFEIGQKGRSYANKFYSHKYIGKKLSYFLLSFKETKKF